MDRFQGRRGTEGEGAMALGGGDCFLGGNFEVPPNPLTCELLTAEGNQVPASWSRNSLFRSDDVSPLGPPGDQALRF